jgi:hypothetical protein
VRRHICYLGGKDSAGMADPVTLELHGELMQRARGGLRDIKGQVQVHGADPGPAGKPYSGYRMTPNRPPSHD